MDIMQGQHYKDSIGKFVIRKIWVRTYSDKPPVTVIDISPWDVPRRRTQYYLPEDEKSVSQWQKDEV